MNHYLWLVRREFWENRAIWILPVALGGTLVIAALFGHIGFSLPNPPTQSRSAAAMGLFAFAALFYVVMAIYSSWYLLDCLYADRKDKSVLFWKSLPLSDSATVLSKVFVALVAIPAVYFAVANVTSVVVAIVTSAIWYLPISGWLLLASAWAKRAVILWALLPPLGIMLAERLFLGTSVTARTLGLRLFGYRELAFHETSPHEWSLRAGDPAAALAGAWRLFDLGPFLANPETWIGILVGAALIALAIQLRVRRLEA
jgi:ABC-2 type transport system permease protein